MPHMSRKRRRFADIMVHSALYLAMAFVSVLFVSSWISNIHAASHPHPTSSGESYLYNTEDSIPVLDHGLSGYDFTKSTAPKVVEFYDPRCGACQAFKANYIEVAKKVQAQKPHVDFYGVSCEVHPSLCDSYGEASVPKIFAFPNGLDNSAQGGIEVPKGAGTIYFLSARLMKALRTPEEIASDAVKLGEMETPERRLLGEYESPDDDDNQVDSEEEDDDDDVSEDEEESAELDSEDQDLESEDEEDYVAAGDQDPSFSKLSEMEEDDAESEDEPPSIEESDPSERSKDQRKAPPVNRAYQAKQGSSPVREDRGRQGIPSSNQATEQGSERVQGDKDKSMNQVYKGKVGELSMDKEARGKLGVTIGDQTNRGKQQTPERKKLGVPPNTCLLEDQCDVKRKQMGVPDHLYHKGRFEAYGCFVEHDKGVFWGYGARENNQKADILSGGMERIWCEDAPRNQEASNGRYEDAALEEKYMTQNRRDEQSVNQNAGSSVPNGRTNDRRGANTAQQQQSGPTESRAQQAIRGEPETDHQQSDAWKNTMAHFEGLDVKRGKEKGYHYEQYKKERDAIMREKAEARQNQNAPQNVPGQTARNIPNAGQINKGDPGSPPKNPHSGPISIEAMRASARKEEEEEDVIQPPPPPPPRQHIPFGGDIFAPNPLNTDPVRAKKFQEYVARRKEMLERNEKMKHPIKTIMGKEEKKNEVESAIFAHKKKSGFQSSHTPRKKGADLRPEAQKHTVGEKVLKKIPIVKRAFKRSKGEELLNDAALSFTRGLLMGVFKTNESLDYKKKMALLDWFDLLRVSLPPEIGLHELIDTLKYNIDNISQRRESLVTIISNHPLPDSSWSYSCTKGAKSGGFFCGFWKLLHVMSIGFAEQAGGLSLRESSPSIRVFSAKEAGAVVREYMALFFNCDKCSKRFIAQYDDCSFQRCHRLSDETVNAPAESWQEFPLWLWQVHNDVSRSKSNRASDFHENLGRKAEAKKWQRDMQAVYPHIDQCIKCVTSGGIWDLNAVYNHLEKEYWEFGHEVDPKMEKFLEYNDIERKKVSHGLGAYILISLIVILGLAAKKHRIRVTGRHKKFEASSSFGRSKKYRNS